jgi:Fe-S-cluster containining protein
MNDRESREIAAHLELEHDAFLARYAYPYKGGHSLTEKKNGDCVFLRGKQCGIYEVRPTQCRTFPFWPETLRSEVRWKETCAACEGIGRGPVHDREEIMATLNRVLAECHDAEW